MSSESPAPPATTPPVGGTAARRARQAADAAAAKRPSGPKRPAARAVGDRPAGDRPGEDPPVVDRLNQLDRLDHATRHELDPDRLAALEEERDFLLRSLADLEREHDAGDVDEHDYAALKDDYTVRAAATLRAIESRQATIEAVRGPRSRGRTWAAVGVVAVLALALGLFVAASAGRRGDGDSLSGNIRQTSRDQVLEAEQMMGTDPQGALERFEQVLQTSPDNVEALTYKGWLLYLSSQSATNAKDGQLLVATALKSLSDAITNDPTFPDARIFRASLYNALGQPDAAAADLAAVNTDAVPEFMRSRVDQLRGEIEAAQSGTTPGTQP